MISEVCPAQSGDEQVSVRAARRLTLNATRRLAPQASSTLGLGRDPPDPIDTGGSLIERVTRPYEGIDLEVKNYPLAIGFSVLRESHGRRGSLSCS